MQQVDTIGTAEVAYINLDTRTVVTTMGKILPITDFFDIFGVETDDPAYAVSCVAGEDGWGWLTIEIEPEDHNPVRLH